MTENKFYSTKQVAELFDVTVATVRTWIREGRLTAVKPGGVGHWRVSEDELRKIANEKLEAR